MSLGLRRAVPLVCELPELGLVMLQEASELIGEIARAIEQNASRAREAFGFAAEANQKANSSVDVTTRVRCGSTTTSMCSQWSSTSETEVHCCARRSVGFGGLMASTLEGAMRIGRLKPRSALPGQ